MSFLSGLFSTVSGFFSGNSLGSTIAKIAISGYALNKLKQSQKANQTAANVNIDEGVKLQVAPASNNNVNVLYGNSFFGGAITDAKLSADNKTMYYTITLSEKTGILKSTGLATAYTFNNVYWNDQRIVFKSDGITVDYVVDRTGVVDRSPSGLIKVYCYAGNSTSQVIPKGYTNTTVTPAYSAMSGWTTSHSMNNLIFAVIQITYNRDKGITGLGQFDFDIDTTLKYPGDVLYDYFTNDMYGAGLKVEDLDLPSLAALTTYAKTSITYQDQTKGLGQVLANRYQINGIIDTSANVYQNIEKICNSCASWLSYDNYEGKWGVIINRDGTKVADFNDSNIISNISIQGTGMSELYNNVKVEFPNKDIRDRADYVNIEIPTADRNSNEITNVLNISYDLINEPVQAQLLGFIELKQSRVDLLISFDTDFSYMHLRAGELITVTNSMTQWVNKVFRVITVTEKHDSDAALTLSILALEYDPNVYSTADLYRYTRTDNNGIITIAGIGTPGTPQVTKTELSNRPRVSISTVSPSGVVEGIEYWYSNNTGQANDDLRSYTLIGIKRPSAGGTFASGTAVVLEVDNLSSGDFVIKTRGVNTITTGPFSAVSGLIGYNPVQTTDAVSPTTVASDGMGGLGTALSVLSLLSKVDGLFGNKTDSGSLFDKMFSVFKDDTGVDLVDSAKTGSLGGTPIDPNIAAGASDYYSGSQCGNVKLGKIQVPGTAPTAPFLQDCTVALPSQTRKDGQDAPLPSYYLVDTTGTTYTLVYNLKYGATNTAIPSANLNTSTPNGMRLGTGSGGWYLKWNESAFYDSATLSKVDRLNYFSSDGATSPKIFSPGRSSAGGVYNGVYYSTLYKYNPLAFQGTANAINNILQGKGLGVYNDAIGTGPAGWIDVTIYKDGALHSETQLKFSGVPVAFNDTTFSPAATISFGNI